MEKVKVLSLFSGIGAYESALERLNIPHEIVRYCEIDKWAALAYSKIHGISEDLNLGDISKVDVKDIPDYNLQTWGFPCTDISLAGKQKGLIDEDGNITRSGLYYEGLRILKAKKPEYSIIENVKNLVGKKFRGEFEQILKDLEDVGYNNYWNVYNAKECTDIPQNRERVFIVSIRKDIDDGTFAFPKGEPCKRRLKDMLDKDVDEKYYLDQERVDKIKNWKSFQNPLERVLGKNSDCPTLTARGAGEWHSGMIILSEDLVETANLRNEPEIQVVASLRGTGKPWDSRHESICRVYGTEGAAPTLTAGGGGGTEVKVLEVDEPIVCEQRVDEGLRFFKDGAIGTLRTIDSCGDKRVIEQKRIRKLTPREAYKLMGFSIAQYDLVRPFLSDTQLYKTAGNSIVVDVLILITKTLFKNMEGK